jgi:hypothetical protein
VELQKKMDNATRFLNDGGKITQCKPIEKSTKLKRYKKHTGKAPIDGHDRDICSSCPNVGRCEFPCSPLKWINGNQPRKEILLGDLSVFDYPDYNQVLAEQIESIREITKSYIEAIKDTQKRAIIVLLDNDFKIKQIAALCHLSERTIYRIKE